MSRCTAPVHGHRTSSGAAACPVHGRSSYRSYTSYYAPPTPVHTSSGGSSSSSGGGGRSARPRWSPFNSPVTYTSDEIAALDRYRSKVEAVGPRAESYDLFLCHAWDDRRETATELHNLLEAENVSVWFSEKDVILGQPFMREIDKGLAKTRIGLVLITPSFLKRVESGGVSEKELSELLSRDLLIPVAHGVTYDEIRSVSPLLGSRNGLSTDEDSIADIAKKVAELVAL
jgi:TIR domain